MTHALLAWPLALGLALEPAAGETDVSFAESALEAGGDLLEVEAVDLDGDGRSEVCLAVRTETGRRELRFHRLARSGVEARPFRVVEVLDEVVAFGFADVRPERGRELVFLTAGGVWSYSLELEGYRGNARQLVDEPLVYDVPDPRALPRWPYVERDAGGDRLLLPGRDGFAIWGPGDDPSGAYRALARFAAEEPQDDGTLVDGGEAAFGSEGGRYERYEDDGPLLVDGLVARTTFLASRRAYRAPAMVDVDGDGALDVVTADATGIALHLAGADGPSARPTRRESFPEYLRRDEARLRFVDLDGDGDLDVLARCADEVDGMAPRDVALLVLRNDGRRLLPEEPEQVLRFEAHELEVEPVDVDGDGRVDLVMRKLLIPAAASPMSALDGVEFEVTDLVFFGTGGRRPFDRKPALKETRTYDEESVLEGIANRATTMDLDGDGLADRVEIDLRGRLAIRRLVRDSSFFGGETWSFESSPWLRFDAFGDLRSLTVEDLNGDGLGDVVSEGAERVAFLLSQRRGGRR